MEENILKSSTTEILHSGQEKYENEEEDPLSDVLEDGKEILVQPNSEDIPELLLSRYEDSEEKEKKFITKKNFVWVNHYVSMIKKVKATTEEKKKKRKMKINKVSIIGSSSKEVPNPLRKKKCKLKSYEMDTNQYVSNMKST